MIRAILRLLLAVTLATSATLVAPAAQSQAATCSGVWVVIDYGSLGGTSTRCATAFSSGTTALSSAGFSITRKSGMICTINALPNPCAISTSAYWSYWHAAKRSDGSYGAWTYSNLGADAYTPKKGDAEGWRFGNGKSAPGVTPPKQVTVASPKPVATKTTTKAAPRPVSTPVRTTSKPKVTAKASTKPSATATKSPTPTPTPTLSPSEVAATPEITSAVVAAAPTQPPTDSPVSTVATLAALLAGGAGLGGWWLLKGRRP